MNALRALAAIEHLAATVRAFTTDDIWAQIGPSENGRAIANAIMRCEHQHLIKSSRIGAYLRGNQNHRRWLTIWLSVPLAGTLTDATQYVNAKMQREHETL